jgi:arylsulfatase A-like enzyme
MKRREFIKTAGGLAGAALAGGASMSPSVLSRQVSAAPKPNAPKPNGRPNILVILVDQLRTPQPPFDQALMDQAAPNLACLRQQSVSFVSHYAAATACSPSRSCLLTGLYTHQNGMFLTNAAGLPGEQPTPDMNPGFPTWGSILGSPDFGYNTFWWGKWHLSQDDQTSQDYITRYGFTGGLPCPSPNGGPGQGLGVDPQTTTAFKNWFNTAADFEPWCTTVSLVNPHDVQWFPKYSMEAPGELAPARIFHALPANFEKWPDALFNENKPTTQYAWTVLTDTTFGVVPFRGPGFQRLWFQLLDLYYLVTSNYPGTDSFGFVDLQIKTIFDTVYGGCPPDPDVASNTIVVFASDHGEYGGAHGLRGKAFAVYEESTRVPLYVYDPTGEFVPPDQQGTERTQLTSHVDLVPLLMTLASGNNDWRSKPQYAHLAGRADLAAMLSDPSAPGRSYILHTSDEDIPEEARKLGIPYRDALITNILPPPPLPQLPPPNHVIGYRTANAKIGVYSNFAPGTIGIETEGQQSELYDYTNYGIAEVTNNVPGGPAPEPELFDSMYDALFNPTTGAVATELRQPMPPFLKQVQDQAIADYLAFEASVQG